MIKIFLLAVVPFMTEHRNVVPKTEVTTNFFGSVTGIVDKAYIEAHGGGGGTITDVQTNGVSIVSGGIADIMEIDPTVPAWAKKARISEVFSQVQWDAINSLISIDDDGNLCFDNKPIVDSSGEILFDESDPIFVAWMNAVTGDDIPVSSTNRNSIATYIKKIDDSKRDKDDLVVYNTSRSFGEWHRTYISPQDTEVIYDDIPRWETVNGFTGWWVAHPNRPQYFPGDSYPISTDSNAVEVSATSFDDITMKFNRDSFVEYIPTENTLSTSNYVERVRSNLEDKMDNSFIRKDVKSIAIGDSSVSYENFGIAIGYGAISFTPRSMALGVRARSFHDSATSIGYMANSHGVDTFNVSHEIGSWYAGDTPVIEAIFSTGYSVSNVTEVITNDTYLASDPPIYSPIITTNKYKIYYPDPLAPKPMMSEKTPHIEMINGEYHLITVTEE